MALKDVTGKYSRTVVKKASQIRALIFDVDGVLTNGRIIYDENGKETKQFNVKDGLIMGYLKKSHILVGAISGRESAAVAKRASELKLDFCHQGIVDKLGVLDKIAEFHKLKKKEIAYIGDDINDLEVLRSCGLSVCPLDSPIYIQKSVDLVAATKGGNGVVREVADLILASKGELEKILKVKSI
jgi:3-deoxy-D-manno-octulosonate 8-phosphate phosphatase (KDO 8-P phosphatase)